MKEMQIHGAMEDLYQYLLLAKWIKLSSRMKLYEKASLTATAGGYRLMASQVLNNQTTVENFDWQYNEAKGYVAFDLFVKNFSGTEYYKENNVANEEAIYLTTDSIVKVANDGVRDTGIENSHSSICSNW